jgi:hypothetical protein
MIMAYFVILPWYRAGGIGKIIINHAYSSNGILNWVPAIVE